MLAPRPSCSSSSHAHAKATPSVWRHWPLNGHQRIDADETGPAECLELRTCPNCHSTLAVVVQEAL